MDHRNYLKAGKIASGSKLLLVDAVNIGVYRAGRWIIRHVNLQVARGQLVYIIGANGSGKSTLAKSILSLIDINEGSIQCPGSLRTGYVPQRLVISPSLPLTLRRLMTLTGRYPKEKIDSKLKAVGLDRLGDPPVTTLSGGELQRLLLARALLREPDLLVLDEPNQGVDMAGADVLQSLIEAIQRESNCGVLMISHNLEQVTESGDDVIVLLPHEHSDTLVIRKNNLEI